MARFDVYRVTGEGPLFLDCQANTFDYLSTRFVVPLLRVGGVVQPTRRLHPVFMIDGTDYIMATQLATAVPVRVLGKVIVSLEQEDGRIRDALDMLMCGF